MVLAGKGGGHLKNAGATAWDAVDDKLWNVWDVVSKTFTETVTDSVRVKAMDDQAMQTFFNVVYSALPADVRRWVSLEQFTAFCFKNRNRLMSLQETGAPSLPPPNTVRRLDL